MYRPRGPIPSWIISRTPCFPRRPLRSLARYTFSTRPHLSSSDLRPRLLQEDLWRAKLSWPDGRASALRLGVLWQRLGCRAFHQNKGRRTEVDNQLTRLCFIKQLLQPRRGWLYHRTVRAGILQRPARQVSPAGCRHRRKIQIIMELRQGISLKVLPYTFTKNVKASKDHPFIKAGTTTWFSPVDKLPRAVEYQHSLYIKNVFSLLNEDVKAGRFDRVNVYFDKMRKYQP